MIDHIVKRLQEGKFALIAEIGVNYYDIAEKLNIPPMEAAKFMVLSARNAGIHAVKFQSYKAGTLASKESPAYWDRSEEPTASQYELFQKFDHFGEAEYRELSRFCDTVGIEFCSTPFDFESADYLAPLMNVYKISSSDLNNLPFVEHIAKKDKPILLSVGASNLDEIREAVEVIRKSNQRELALLHCVLEYPTPYEHANLGKIAGLKEAFPDAFIGYSDHTKPDAGHDVIKTAYLLGAKVVEKHFTVDKALQGNDHYHAMDGRDAMEILRCIDWIDRLKGSPELVCGDGEAAARRNARRSIVAARDLPSGTVLERDMLLCKRPGYGIPPTAMTDILGRRLAREKKADSILEWEDVEP